MRTRAPSNAISPVGERRRKRAAGERGVMQSHCSVASAYASIQLRWCNVSECDVVCSRRELCRGAAGDSFSSPSAHPPYPRCSPRCHDSKSSRSRVPDGSMSGPLRESCRQCGKLPHGRRKGETRERGEDWGGGTQRTFSDGVPCEITPALRAMPPSLFLFLPCPLPCHQCPFILTAGGTAISTESIPVIADFRRLQPVIPAPPAGARDADPSLPANTVHPALRAESTVAET